MFASLKIAVTCSALMLVLGCAATAPRESSSPSTSSTVFGYREDGAAVRFEFVPRQYAQATRDVSGEFVDVSALRIESVTVAGEFNAWSKTEWPMQRKGSRYVLTKAKSELGSAPSYQFKFVVNGEWWVEPPLTASNQKSTGFMNNSANLVLEVH